MGNRIAVIPARGGSRRIPRKNVRIFSGRPMIAWAIDAARSSGLFAQVVVSTDDAEIAEIARDAGASVPFTRPASLADDTAGTDAVLLHAIEECTRIYGPFAQGCCIYPAVPMLDAADLHQGLKLLETHDATSAFPVVEYDFPLEQAFVLQGVHPRPRWPDAMSARSQDLPVHYHDAGIFYWFQVDRLVRAGRLFSDDCVAFPIPAERCQDINTVADWERAELKFRAMHAAQ